MLLLPPLSTDCFISFRSYKMAHFATQQNITCQIEILSSKKIFFLVITGFSKGKQEFSRAKNVRTIRIIKNRISNIPKLKIRILFEFCSNEIRFDLTPNHNYLSSCNLQNEFDGKITINVRM